MPSARAPAVKSADMPSRISLGLPPCPSASWAAPDLSCAAAAWPWGDGLSKRQRGIDTAATAHHGLRLELPPLIVLTGIVAFRPALCFSFAKRSVAHDASK